MPDTKYTIDFGGLGRLLRCMDATPIRRHKCDVCHDVFECHLCTIEDDHALHGGPHVSGTVGGNGRTENKAEPVFVCTECIRIHDLNTVVLAGMTKSMSKITGKLINISRQRQVSYYDHETGERLK